MTRNLSNLKLFLQWCKNRGGHLLEVTTEYENQLLSDNLELLGLEKLSYYWIGLKRHVDRKWYWQNNDYKAPWVNWKENEQSNYDCACINDWESTKWITQPCTFLEEHEPVLVICEA